jgi:murein DD-endopeptidase MepM/ murein hydrolase activator NlpD
MRRLRLGLCLLAGAGMLTGALAGTVPALAATGSTAGVAATGGGPLNLRATPSSAAARRGTVPSGGRLALVCRVTGQQVRGFVRTTNQWDRLSNGRYASDGYVRRSATPPVCATGSPGPGGSTAGNPGGQPTSWVAPVVAPVGDGFRSPSRPTHQGVDLLAARNTPIRAVAAGTVITVTCNASTKNCDVDGGRQVAGCGWYVEVAHPGKVISRYCHMGHRPLVRVGQRVVVGQMLGLVGSSGHSSGPHLHFEVHLGTPPAVSANATDPVAFMRTHAAPLGLRH